MKVFIEKSCKRVYVPVDRCVKRPIKSCPNHFQLLLVFIHRHSGVSSGSGRVGSNHILAQRSSSTHPHSLLSTSNRSIPHQPQMLSNMIRQHLHLYSILQNRVLTSNLSLPEAAQERFIVIAKVRARASKVRALANCGAAWVRAIIS